MTYAPSCAFETTDSSGDVTELVFYITDDTAGVLKYIADSYAANDIAAGTEAGTWDVEDATVKAVVGSPADDPKNNPLVGAAYVVLTVS